MDRGHLDIVFCINDRYVPFVSVSIKSIADNNKSEKVRVHILTDNITKKSRNRLLSEFSDSDNPEIIFYYIDDSSLQGLQAWSKYTWYRLLLPSVLPADIDKVLYLDTDTLICGKLTDLFATDITNYAVAGVIDPIHFHDEAYLRCAYPSEKGYLCAGVLLVNLDFWRKNQLQKTLLEWAHRHPDIKFHDQDCINTVCQDHKLFLPLKYGVIDALFSEEKIYTSTCLDEIEESISHPVIIHYAGKAPWFKDAADHFMSSRWHECNRSLKNPARLTYKSTGLLKLKIQIYDLLHPHTQRHGIREAEISQRLDAARKKHNTQ